MNRMPNEPDDLEAQAEELADMIDALVAGGSDHINLQVGEKTHVQTVNSTDCSGTGACAVPTFFDDEDGDTMQKQYESDESDDEDFF